MKFYPEKFRIIRKEKRYTIKKLASDIGVTRATIWNWENGKRTPNETIIRKLAAILEVKTIDFQILSRKMSFPGSYCKNQSSLF